MPSLGARACDLRSQPPSGRVAREVPPSHSHYSVEEERAMPKTLIINITGKSIAWLLAAAGLIWLAMNFSSILLMLFIAILLAVAITPLVERLERRRLPRPLAIGLIYVGLLL